MDSLPHGTENGYKNFKCRCDLCKAAAVEARKQRKQSVPEGVKHGSRSTYHHYGCRCEPCRTANRDYDRERMAKNERAREVAMESTRRYRERHPDRVKDTNRKVYEKRKALFWDKLQADHKRYSEAYRLRSKGIAATTEAELLAAQNGLCAICGKPDKRKLSIDHCHETGRIRGLLCRRCNLGLGCFGDNLETLKLAIEYLEKN